jgi:hypothetical protein
LRNVKPKVRKLTQKVLFFGTLSSYRLDREFLLLTFVKERLVSHWCRITLSPQPVAAARAFIYPPDILASFKSALHTAGLFKISLIHALITARADVMVSHSSLACGLSFLSLSHGRIFRVLITCLFSNERTRRKKKIAGFMSYKNFLTPRLCVWNGACNNKSVRRQRIMRS